MGGFSSPIASQGGGSAEQSYDPAQYLGGAAGQSQDGAGGASPQAQAGQNGTSPQYANQIVNAGMKLEQGVNDLLAMIPEAAEELRVVKESLRKAVAKGATSSKNAQGGPMAPRSV
jgi:hypothetical protein